MLSNTNCLCLAVILLHDPLPAISDFQTPVRSQRRRAHESSPQVEAHAEPIPMSLPMVPRAPLHFPTNKFYATHDEIDNLRNSTAVLTSTADAVRDVFKADPILGILRVVHVDTKAFFQALEWALDEISQDSLDDFLMTRRLADWRKMMSDLEIEVPAIGKSVRDFAHFIFGGEKASKSPEGVSDIIKDLDNNILRIKQRLGEAYMALRADMQFTESRRSITETKTVTKLTELAFIFIPLSFTASLFSMSVRELDNGVPVWTFIVTAVVMAVLSYGIRVLVTSDSVADSSRRALERFWTRRNVRRGQSAPFFTLVLLTTQDLWSNGGAELVKSVFFVVFISAFILVPVAFLWTSTKLDVGLPTAVTLLFILSGITSASFIIGSGLSDTSERWAAWFHGRTEPASVTLREDV